MSTMYVGSNFELGSLNFRHYLPVSHVHQLIAAACLLLAGKVEDELVQAKDIVMMYLRTVRGITDASEESQVRCRIE